MSALGAERPASRRRRRRTPAGHAAQQEAHRITSAMDAFAVAIAADAALKVPPAVIEIERVTPNGRLPLMGPEAYELARRVYYLEHGTLADAARAVLAAGLGNIGPEPQTDTETIVFERLKNWWLMREWPQREHWAMVAIRDAQSNGGLHRGRLCKGAATGNGPAPVGTPCAQSAMNDSDYCFHHDPRPEYAERRAEQGRRFVEARAADMVDIEPFQRFLDATRRGLLEEAKASGQRVHPNNRGWGLLAAAMNADQSLLSRVALKGHSSLRPETERGRIRASTVVRWLEPLQVPFQDVYGFAPPASTSDSLCACGAAKDHGSGQCRACWERDHVGAQCTYVKQGGRRCPTRTTHPSGQCAKCRRTTERERVPAEQRNWRESNLTKPIRLFALMEYRDLPSWQWVAARLWQHDAGGVRAVYSSQKVLAGSLVRQLGQGGRGVVKPGEEPIRTPADAQRAMAPLIAELGELEFPDTGAPADLSGVSLVPFGPFREWLADRHREVGSYNALAGRLRKNADWVSTIVRGATRNSTGSMRRASIEQMLDTWGDGTTFADLYGGAR